MKIEPRILIVDDDTGCTRAVSRLLERAGMRVEIVTTVREALDALASKEFDCVVTEMLLPDGPGAPLLETLEKIHPDTGRVVLTGSMDYVAIEEAINRGGVHAFYAKPWDAASLTRGIVSVLEKGALSRENRMLLKRLEDRNAELERLVAERTAQLEKAKRELEAIFDAADEPVAIVSANHEVIRANRAYAFAAGTDDMRSLPGKRCHEMMFSNPLPCPECPIYMARSGRARALVSLEGRTYEVEARPFTAYREVAFLCCYRPVVLS